MKGQSKALELVIVLFVLVVVAWVVINLFQSLIQEQTQKLQNIQTQEELKGKISEAIRICEERCSNYKKSRSKKDLVDFCGSSIELDLNQDGDLSFTEESVYASISLGGVGVCEDRIPCFALVECDVGETRIDAQTCQEAVCSYFSEEIPASDEVRELRLNEMLNPGKCYKPTQIFHWFNLYFNGTSPGELRC